MSAGKRGRVMKKGTVKKVMRAIDGVMERLLTAGMPELSAKQKRDVLRASWTGSQERRLMERQTTKAPEPKEGEMESALIGLEDRLDLIKTAIERTVQKASSTHRGPRPRIPKQKQRDVCAQIKALHEVNRKPIREAVFDIATLYKVHERTIYRIWKRQSELLS
jgi:hypothetical protein